MTESSKTKAKWYIGDKIPPNIRTWIEISWIGLIAIFFLLSESWQIGIAFLFLFFYLSPIKQFRSWVDKIKIKLISIVGSLFNLVVWLVVVGIIIWITSAVSKSIGSIGKYEGMSAKEWYYEYDYAETSLISTRSELEDTQEELESVQEELNDIESCVRKAYFYGNSSVEDIYYDCL